jgi:predicted DNA-binding transcriptional regulator YafY
MRADRLLSMMLLLQANGRLTTQALAESLEVSRRTILRDIDALSIAGIPIYAEAGHGGGVYLDENYRISLTGLNEAEVRALFVSTEAGPLRDIGLAKASDSILLKLFAALPSLHQKEVERVQQRIYLDPAWWWHTGQTLPFLETFKVAIFEDRRLAVRYERGNGEIIARVIEPYSLVAKASVWYLIALRDNEFRTYRVSRFQDVQVLDEKFHRQAHFDLATYWQQHSREFVANVEDYRFTLRLNADRLQFLKWYASGRYQLTIADDGNGDGFIAQVTLGSLESARMFVMGIGLGACVIDPPELRQAVVELAEALVDLYATTTPSKADL